MKKRKRSGGGNTCAQKRVGVDGRGRNTGRVWYVSKSICTHSDDY